MIQIEFARGDSYERGFILKRSGAAVTEVFDEIYFTVKKYSTDDDFIFQKRMSTGGITADGNGHYTLFIAPEDTNDMNFEEYDCDIEVVKDDYKKTFFGKMKLTREVTHACNER